MRGWVALCLVACRKDEPVRDGVSRVHVELGERTIGVRYTVKLAALPANGVGKAACQVGADRFVMTFDAAPKAWVANEPIEVDAAPFMQSLPAKPSLCDLTILGERFCMGEASFVRGACAPNPVSGASVHGLSARLLSVTPKAKDGPFPAHLDVVYAITAHADQTDGDVVRRTTCMGASDETSHAVGSLKQGESLYEGMMTPKTGRAQGVTCKTTFGFQPGIDDPIEPISEACHVDDRIVPCPT